MQDDLYPPGMAPRDQAAAERPRTKSHPDRARPATARLAELLPPGAAETTPHLEDTAVELGDLLPDAALPPEVEESPIVPVASDLPAHRPLSVGTAPAAARVVQRHNRQTLRFMLLAMLGSVAIGTLLGVGYVLIRRQEQLTAVVERDRGPEPAPEPTRKPERQRPSRPKSNAARPQVPPVAQTNEPALDDSLPSEPEPAAAPDFNVSSPAEPPSAAPPAVEPPPAAKPSRAEVEQLAKTLQEAKTALGEANFPEAAKNLTTAQSLARLPQHQAAVDRLKQISNHVRTFHDAVQAAAQNLQAGETFKVGTSTQVSFVEAKPDAIILRIAGTNRTYSYTDLPPGLALALADLKLPSSDPAGNIAKGAYLLVHKRADTETRSKAESLWQQAQSSGLDLAHLMPFLDDDYAKLAQVASD